MSAVPPSAKKKSTPDYFHCIEDKRFRSSVYEPEADSFLFLDGLDADADFLQSLTTPRRVVEIGCGSGIVITHLESIIACGPGDAFHVVDVNPIALEAAALTWSKSLALRHLENRSGEASPLPPLHKHLGDLFSPFAAPTSNGAAAVEGKMESAPQPQDLLAPPHRASLLSTASTLFDIVLFNPPYVPTSMEELSQAIAGDDVITAAWCGGPNGRVVVDRFMQQLPYFLNPDGGVCYIIAIKENDVGSMEAFLKQAFRDAMGDKGGMQVNDDALGQVLEISTVLRRYTAEDVSLLRVVRRISSTHQR